MVKVAALIVAAIVSVAAVVLALSNATVLVGAYPWFESYRPVDAHTIVLTVAVAPRSWTRVTSVVESSTDVVIKVESLAWPIPLPGTNEAELRELTVTLTDDLATRVVRDARGQVVPASVRGPGAGS